MDFGWAGGGCTTRGANYRSSSKGQRCGHRLHPTRCIAELAAEPMRMPCCPITPAPPAPSQLFCCATVLLLPCSPAGKIMKLTTFCPWKEHLYGLEEEMGIAGEVLYCLYEVSHTAWCGRAVLPVGTGWRRRWGLPSWQRPACLPV